MARALFETLAGAYSDGTPLGDAHDAGGQLCSIRDHLSRLLNARGGVLRHLPDYGLPDLPSLYRELPYSLEDLAQAVQELISRYEPRLKHVQVQAMQSPKADCVVALEIVGVLADGSFGQFQTQLESGGAARIKDAQLQGGAHARVL